MTRKILIATDGSEAGNRAIDLAAELSLKLPTELIIVHVLMQGRPPNELRRMAEIEHMVMPPPPPGALGAGQIGGTIGALLAREITEDGAAHETARIVTALGEEVLDRATRRAEAGGATRIRTHLARGDTADAILDLAAEEGVEMIVMGRRGLGLMRGTVLGSVSQKVLQHAPCAVVVLR